MSAESWKLEKDLCRCCHAEGSFHNLSQTRSHLGKEEVYSEMLRSALNIDLSPVSGPLCAKTYTICDGCALRLRDATHFRQQVMTCEEYFKDMYHNVLKTLSPSTNVSIEVKQETLPSCDAVIKVEYPQLDDDDDDNDGFDMQFDDDDDDDDKTVLQMKLEDAKRKAKAKAKPKTKAKKAPKRPRPKKPNADEAGTTGDNEAENPKPKKGSVNMPKFAMKDTDYTEEGTNFMCRHCDKKYDKKFSLRYHVKTKHYKIPRFVCQYCKEAFMTPAPLTVHKLEKHNIDDRFKCQACNAVFNTKVQLRKHRNIFHMLGEKYKCELCEYESFSFEGMYKHKFKHKTEKDYHCRFCRKSFLRKATLDLHERIHTGDRRKVCKECGQTFVQKASLNYHMTKYHPAVNF